MPRPPNFAIDTCPTNTATIYLYLSQSAVGAAEVSPKSCLITDFLIEKIRLYGHYAANTLNSVPKVIFLQAPEFSG